MPTELERARRELGGDSSLSTGKWLRSLADALDEPAIERPWWTSKVVLAILAVAGLFVGVHVLLLLRVLSKVHAADSTVLLLPLAGLSASALVGLLALIINWVSERPKRA